MIVFVFVMVVFTLIYTHFYSYDFIINFVKSGFDIPHLIIVILIVMLMALNFLLNLQIHDIDRKFFQRRFDSEKEYNKETRSRYLLNGISRFLLIFILPLLFILFFFVFDKISMLNSLFVKIVLITVSTIAFLIGFAVFYVTDIMMGLNLLLSGEAGFGSFCSKCNNGGVDIYKVSKENSDKANIVYKCQYCGNEIKVEKFRHIFIDILKKIHLHK